MKISILLPYKENFSPIYAGAVSLFVKDTTNLSKFKKYITVYGNTDLTNIYKLKYKNIKLKKNIFIELPEIINWYKKNKIWKFHN